MSSALTRATCLSDWTFVIGQPTTHREFKAGQVYGEYASNFPSFADYDNAFLLYFRQLIVPLARGFGLRLLRYPNSRAYAHQLSERRNVLLLTHCSTDGKLEFADGMVPFSDIVRRVSPDFAGIAEICACKPLGLNRLLKTRAPGCAVTIRMENLRGPEWLVYCARLLMEFYPGPKTYWDAILRVNYLLQGRDAEPRPTMPSGSVGLLSQLP
jgi:hypothetical protein